MEADQDDFRDDDLIILDSIGQQLLADESEEVNFHILKQSIMSSPQVSMSTSFAAKQSLPLMTVSAHSKADSSANTYTSPVRSLTSITQPSGLEQRSSQNELLQTCGSTIPTQQSSTEEFDVNRNLWMGCQTKEDENLEEYNNSGVNSQGQSELAKLSANCSHLVVSEILDVFDRTDSLYVFEQYASVFRDGKKIVKDHRLQQKAGFKNFKVGKNGTVQIPFYLRITRGFNIDGMRKFFKINDQFVGSHFEVIYKNEALETSQYVPVADEETDAFKRTKSKCTKLTQQIKDSSLKLHIDQLVSSSNSIQALTAARLTVPKIIKLSSTKDRLILKRLSNLTSAEIPTLRPLYKQEEHSTQNYINLEEKEQMYSKVRSLRQYYNESINYRLDYGRSSKFIGSLLYDWCQYLLEYQKSASIELQSSGRVSSDTRSLVHDFFKTRI